MKLYYSPGACSLSPHIVAAEAGIAVELEKVDLRTHTTQTGEDYYAINPKGYVPALVLDDGALLTEGPAIVQYLADLKPQTGLLAPVGTFARYKVVEWLTFTNSEIHKTFGTLFGKAPDEAKADAKARIAKRLETVSKGLGTQDYLTGGFTVADAYMFVMLRWAGKMGIALPDNLAGLSDRIAARSKVKAVLQQEGLD